MVSVQIGSRVTISYIGTLDNGRVFYSSDENGPMTVTIGADQIFPALELALIGMCAGETKNIVLSPVESYGPRRDDNLIKVERQSFPPHKKITAGKKLSIDFEGGSSRIMVVTDVNDTEVTLDGNHPLAGHALTFALRVDTVA